MATTERVRGANVQLYTPKEIHLDDWNYRPIDWDYVKQLADEIEHDGKIINPGAVISIKQKDGSFKKFLRRGEHRYHALALVLKRNPKCGILFPAISYNRGESEKLMLVESFRDNTRLADTPLDRARYVQRLLATKDDDGSPMTIAKVADEMKLSVVYIKGLIMLAEAPDEITKLIEKKKITGTLAIKMLRESASPEQATIALSNMVASASEKQAPEKSSSGSGSQKKTAPVTARHRESINSIKSLKKFMKKVDSDEYKIKPGMEATISLLKSILKNEVEEKAYVAHFTNGTKN